MLQKRPKRLLTGEVKSEERGDNIEYFKKVVWELPEMSEDERFVIEENKKPLPKSDIINHLSRYLEIHKRHTVDSAKLPILYMDYADKLFGYPEYAVTLGILDLVNDRKIVFFPNVGEVESAIESHVIQMEEKTEWIKI